MQGYFYRLLTYYLSFFVRDEDVLIEVTPQNALLADRFRSYRTYCPGGGAGTSQNAASTSFENGSGVSREYWLLNGNLHYERDIQSFLLALAAELRDSSRVLIVYYSSLWKPLLGLASWLGLRSKTPEENWISHADVENFLRLAGLEVISVRQRVLFPIPVPLAGWLLNTVLAPLPFFRLFTMVNLLVARRLPKPLATERPSVSIVVPARNEQGNIAELVRRCPTMGPDDELILIEGNSTDDTWAEIERVQREYAGPLRVVVGRQPGRGKGDAVRKGFSLAHNEILMILDADMTVPPEELPKFYAVVTAGLGEFVNGSRLVYPMDKRAMRFLNMVANKFFAVSFSFVLGQNLKDTLCGTKVIRRTDYERLAWNRAFFGKLDPFGDFDLIFGAARMGLRIIEIPIRYRERTYGETNIQRWRHGALLLVMLCRAARKFLFVG